MPFVAGNAVRSQATQAVNWLPVERSLSRSSRLGNLPVSETAMHSDYCRLLSLADGLDMSAIREVKFLQELQHPNVIEVCSAMWSNAVKLNLMHTISF
jgi:hypothetical protein